MPRGRLFSLGDVHGGVFMLGNAYCFTYHIGMGVCGLYDVNNYPGCQRDFFPFSIARTVSGEAATTSHNVKGSKNFKETNGKLNYEISLLTTIHFLRKRRKIYISFT